MYQQNSKSTIDGRSTEDLFQKTASKYCYDVFKAATNDDKNKGIDFYLRFGALNRAIQVKGPKRVDRNDDEYSTKFTWFELKNIAGGPGSLMKETDYTALYMPWVQKFILFSTKELREYIVKHVDYSKPPLTKKHGILEWDRYTRSDYGKADEIVLVSYEALRVFYALQEVNYDPNLLVFEV